MKLSQTLQITLLGILGIVIVIAIFESGIFGVQFASASVPASNDYFATSTAPSSSSGAFTITTTRLLTGSSSGRPCALGTVVITGANTAGMDFYDATTSNINLRTNQAPTSTILLASFPPSATVGSYPIDAQCSNGLLLSIPVGGGANVPTTTISYRQY